jgi:GntR family transcriptional regulator
MALYEDEAAELLRRIENGDFAGRKTLPQIRDLAKARAVSTSTIRTAIALLEQHGFVRRVRGQGTIILPPPPARRTITLPGDLPHEWTASATRSTQPAPASVASILGIAPDASIRRQRRVTVPAGEPPLVIADTWLSATADANALDDAIGAWQAVTARAATRDHARLLEITPGLPVIEITEVRDSPDSGHPLTVTVCVLPANRVQISVDSHGGGCGP